MYKGKEYTPRSFADMLGLKMDDFIPVTSFTHHPFYKPFVLEVPDNWSNGLYYNVKLDELKKIVDDAIEKDILCFGRLMSVKRVSMVRRCGFDAEG